MKKEFMSSIATAPTSDANQTHQVVVMFQSKSDKNTKPKWRHPPILRPRWASNNNGANATKTKGVNGIGSQANPNKIEGSITNHPVEIIRLS